MFGFLKKETVADADSKTAVKCGNCVLVTDNGCGIEMVEHSCIDCEYCTEEKSGKLFCTKLKIANPANKSQLIDCTHARMIHYLCGWNAEYFKAKEEANEKA